MKNCLRNKQSIDSIHFPSCSGLKMLRFSFASPLVQSVAYSGNGTCGGDASGESYIVVEHTYILSPYRVPRKRCGLGPRGANMDRSRVRQRLQLQDMLSGFIQQCADWCSSMEASFCGCRWRVAVSSFQRFDFPLKCWCVGGRCRVSTFMFPASHISDL